MIVLLSPAKRMDESAWNAKAHPNSEQIQTTEPWFLTHTETLIAELKKLDMVDLIEMMNVSLDIAKLNVSRYQNFNKAASKPALFLFQGDSYRSLDAKTLSQTNLAYAQNHLLILSGLYGLVRPLDQIKPYRLEMGTHLTFKPKGKTNLPDFWKEVVNQKLTELTKNKEVIINCASAEYFEVIDSTHPIINVIFKQKRSGGLKTFGILAKKARGAMARYIIEHEIKEVESLKKFNRDGYAFNSSMSDGRNLVFIQEI